MKTKGLFFILLLPIGLSFGCKKDSIKSVMDAGTVTFDGNYSGKFLAGNQSGVALTENVVIFLHPGQFSSLMNTSTVTTGSGSYLINGGTATFTNTQVFPEKTSVVTTAVLNGTYTYALKGDSIFLTKTEANKSFYSYKLVKQ